MNTDYTSDIKQVQRFMFDNSVYLLNMFQKKIDSFIGSKSKQSRQKQLLNNRQPNNRLDPANFMQDPIKALAKDLTKPIWNCIVSMNSSVYLDNQRKTQVESCVQSDPLRTPFNNLLKRFIQHYKSQHEDESNLKVNINECNRPNQSKQINLEFIEIKQIKDIKEISFQDFDHTQQLFQIIRNYINRKVQAINAISDQDQNQQYQCQRSFLQAYSEIVQAYLDDQAQIKSENHQLNWFVSIAMQAMINILDSKAGATLLTIQPKIGLINLLIHPLLICIHNNLHFQTNYLEKGKIKQNNPKQTMEMEEDKFIFKDNIFRGALSKVAFINLDGYESQFNLDFVKYMSKFLLYVSFPKQSNNNSQTNELKDFQNFKSQRLLRKFFYQSLTPDEKAQLLSLHEINEKQFKANLFIMPINLRSLTNKYQLINQQNGSSQSSIQFYESVFIKFMMQQVIISCIREFNPSIIIVSYSGKIQVQNDYFAQMIKQLTVISNFRFMMYINKAKMFCFHEKGEYIASGQDFFNQQKQYYQTYQETSINVFKKKTQINPNSATLDLDFLDKLAIFMKIGSGTYNLSKTVEQDSYIQKYKNYKIMRYSALLLKCLAKQFANIQRIKMRTNEYLTISKVLKNNYTNKSESFDKLFEKVITKYHISLIKTIQNLLFMDLQTLQANLPKLSPQQIYIIESIHSYLIEINKQYDTTQLKTIWQDYKFQYQIQLSTDKTQNRFYLQIPKFKDKNYLLKTKLIEDHVLAVEFQIASEKKTSVELTSDTKILYMKQRKWKQSLIYVINHIPRASLNYLSFYGILNQTIDQKSQMKLQLKPIKFNCQRKLSQYQNFIDFNYYQTQNYVFLFWPKIFQDIKEKLCKILGQKYIPTTTWYVFKALKSQPSILNQLSITNDDYQYVLPRNGCTCFSMAKFNRIYIFGGFYNNTQNYMSFQTDISYIDFDENSDQAHVKNVPKSFYLLTQQDQELNEHQSNANSFIKEFKNDFVRPRVQYQIFEPQFANQFNRKQIFLIAGVGQKFLRPFSLISYTGHKILFTQNGELYNIKRIKTNNLLPVNLRNPTKCRSTQQMNIVTNAQNRSIYLNEGMTTQQSMVISQYRYTYDFSEERFDFETIYQFADYQKKTYRDQTTQLLKKGPVQVTLKYDLLASSFRGKQYIKNFIKVSQQNGKKYIFDLQLQLSIQAKNRLPNYQKIMRLTGASIISIDINQSMLYCLIKHPSVTLDKCILAQFNISDLQGKLVDSKAVDINLKEIHKFQKDVSRNAIVVVKSGTVLVLHGFKLNNKFHVPEMKLHKHKKNQLRTLIIKPCTESWKIIKQEDLKKNITNQISASFFINQNSGIILCLTLKSIDRIKNQDKGKQSFVEIVYLRIDRLNMVKESLAWQLIHQGIYKFCMKNAQLNAKNTQINGKYQNQQTNIKHQNKEINLNEVKQQKLFVNAKQEHIRLIEIKAFKDQKQKKQKQFQLKAIFNQQIYSCILNIQAKSNLLNFVNKKITEEQYQKFIYKENIKQESIMLQKNYYTYEELERANDLFDYDQGKNQQNISKMEIQKK